ncbi:MAG: hypothetical protein AAFO84_10350 [Cyanobacteria bacterium J06598_1]
MDTHLIRLAWSIVDKTPLPQKQSFTVGDRIGDILSTIDRQTAISPHERQQIHQYLVSRQHLLTELYQ